MQTNVQHIKFPIIFQKRRFFELIKAIAKKSKRKSGFYTICNTAYCEFQTTSSFKLLRIKRYKKELEESNGKELCRLETICWYKRVYPKNSKKVILNDKKTIQSATEILKGFHYYIMYHVKNEYFHGFILIPQKTRTFDYKKPMYFQFIKERIL